MFSPAFYLRFTLALSVSSVAHNALAGHPSEDPVVAAVRTMFTQAHTPSINELSYGKVWDCTLYNALRGQATQQRGDVQLFAFKSASTQDLVENMIAESTVKLL